MNFVLNLQKLENSNDYARVDSSNSDNHCNSQTSHQCAVSSLSVLLCH